MIIPFPRKWGCAFRGQRVKVPFGKQEKIGIVIHECEQSEIPLEQLKPIHAVLDETPLFPNVSLEFIEKVARYYHHPIGEVIFTGLPQRSDKAKIPPLKKPHPKNTGDVITPSPEQRSP